MMIYMFSNHEKYAKKIRKSQRLLDYEAAVSCLFEEQDILEGVGVFSKSE